MNNATFATFTSAELVGFYNANVAADKQIKKFADRATGLRRCAALLDSLVAAREVENKAKYEANRRAQVSGFADHGCVDCPVCGIDLRNGVSQHGDDVNGKPLRHDTHEFECMGCGAGFGKLLRKVGNSSTRSAAIAKSWTDTSVAMARAQRTQVQVVDAAGVGRAYPSVAKAFSSLGLPMSKHIAFRMALKAAGAQEFGPYKFTAVAA